MNTIESIREAARLANDGEVAEAKRRLLSLSDCLTELPDPLAECVLAHHLADLQDDPHEELRWDLISLAAADQVTDARAAAESLRGGRRGLYPSIHLNLAEDYLKLGDRDAARRSVRAAGDHLDVLPDDSYGHRSRAGFARLDAEVRDATV